MARPSVLDMERVKRFGRYLAGKPRAKRWFRCNSVESWKRARTPIGEVTELLDDRCQPESS